MVVPMGGVTMQEENMAPSIVKDEYAKWWWALLAFLSVVSIGRIVAADVFGALISGIIAFTAWYMVRENCAQMSQYCVMMFGLCCALQAIFEVIAVAMIVSGRSTERTTRTPVSPSKVTYTTVVETHPFFDTTMGWHYNFQSGMKIVTAFSMIVAAMLSHVTYNVFPSALFSDGGSADGSSPAMGGRLLGTGPAGYGTGAGNAYQGNFGTPSGAGHRLGGAAPGGPRNNPGGVRVFEGSGHVLGGN
mmetsp:Transcript_31908/g.72504  ORF Transcript_31908/g.72504 Transcript_31908/m.72504 type:complete len:246 (+) Transcript_31908:140-877(+)|eukprot:CAMPEP_0197897334 /NCGR_PEP_ID=MMETSP1439-20131203/42127_1 /TAXON_ID=66791 /ORGANISM="Gonyaulax spinifera, Strain CCMP409" /LENGTH=245 /DNA_ID=CAMNT_0043517959 /DNA_START=137 /DNA_END=874 /DNA_ORIENTATION=-